MQKEPAPANEPEYVLFPNERLGNQVDLNWSLCRIGMPPIGDAYRNLHLRALVSLASGSLDANKALHAQTSAARTLHLAKASGEHRLVARNIKQHLGQGGNIFVHDAAFSTAAIAPLPAWQAPPDVSIKPSNPSAKAVHNPAPPAQRLGPANPNLLRFITDSVHTAIALHHLLPATRLGDPWHFVPGATLLHASSMTDAAAGLKAQEGSASADFFVYNTEAGEALLNGGIQHVLEAVGVAGASRLWPTAVPLRAAYDTDRNLYLGSPEHLAAATAALHRAGKLVAAHQVFWSDRGITAAFKGALLPAGKAALGRGDIAFDNIDRAVFRLPQQRSVFAHPAKLVLLSDAARKSAPSAADAVAHLVGKDGVLSSAHFPAFDRVATVDVKAVTEKLHALMKASNASVSVASVDKIAS